MIEISNVSKNFGGIKVLNKCSFEIDKGKITALIGPNGSGKSTLFNVISKLLKKDKGRFYFNGKDVEREKDFEVARLGVARTFQEVRLFKNLTIRDHLDIALDRDDESLLNGILGKRRDNLEKIKEILELVGLDKPLNTFAIDLSYGQRKLLDLAIAIAKPHSVLLLDEPVAGVNPKLRGSIKGILKRLKEMGETILVIEHDMNFVMDIADWVFVMDAGEVIAEGKPNEIQKSKKVLEAYLGD